MALSEKQQRFIDEYMIDLNATAAYKRAGYKVKNDNCAAASAAALLRVPKIHAEIQSRRIKQQGQANVDAVRVLRELVCLGISDIGDILDFTQPEPRLRPANEIPEHARRAIQSVKVKRYWEGTGDDAREVEVTEFRLWPKLEALKEIAARISPPEPIRVDVTSGGKAIEQRELIRAEAIAEAMRLVGLARPDVSRNGTQQLVDTAHATLETRGVPSLNGSH